MVSFARPVHNWRQPTDSAETAFLRARDAVELDGLFSKVVVSPGNREVMPSPNSAEFAGTPGLGAAAAQFFGPTVLIPLVASLLIGLAAFVVMRLYVRAVFRESRRSSSIPHTDSSKEQVTRTERLAEIGSLEFQIEEPSEPTKAQRQTTSTFQHAAAAFRRAALVYVLGGFVFTVTSVGLLFTVGAEPLPVSRFRLTMWACYAGVLWSWCLITTVALAMFWGPDRRSRVILFAVYVITLPAVGLLLELAGAQPLPFADVGLMPKDEATLMLSFASAATGRTINPESVTFSPFLQPILFWSLTASPILLVCIAFNRLVRGTVGPVFVNVALIMVLSTLFITDVVLGTSAGLWFVRNLKRVFGGATLQLLWVIGAAVSAFAAWFGLRWIARSYHRKQLSDQMFLFDSLWLSMSIFLSVLLMNHLAGYLLGLVPFVLYRVVVRHGLKPLAARAGSLPGVHLLFLRVFGSPSRSERLFDLLSARWRYAGSIQVISGADVARARFEPDEFLDFLSGRLASAYIRTSADLDRRVANLDLSPDPDGRFRVNEFFCLGDTWKQTVRRLMARSDLVAVDLRAFTSGKTGVLFELGALIDDVPLNHVVLLIDETTDEPFLRRTLIDLWRNMSPESPNALARTAKARMINLARGYPATVRHLMHLGDEILASRAIPICA